jgi:OPA family glycerol-3-phosphate transporter-like MFS transporter
VVLGHTVDRFGWDGGFVLLVGAALAAVVLLGLSVLGDRPRGHTS